MNGCVLSGTAVLALPFLPLAAIPVDVWWCIVISAIIHAVYILALSTAYEIGDISFVYPIARSAPAFVPVAAYFVIGEDGVVEEMYVGKNSENVPWEWWAFGD